MTTEALDPSGWAPNTRAEALRLCKALKLVHTGAPS